MKKSDEYPEIRQYTEMVNFIQKEFAKNISVDDISSAGAVGKTKCFEIFSRYAKKSPKDFLNEYRLEVSREMLCNSPKSIAEISADCGFNSQSYFSTQFAKHYDSTPAEYRNKKFGSQDYGLIEKSPMKFTEIQESLFEAISNLSYYFYKIIKVNLKDASYIVIKPDSSDSPEELLSKRNLSKWLEEFLNSSKIYIEDKTSFRKNANLDYMRRVFLKKIKEPDSDEKPFIRFRYRRLIRGEYRWVLMEVLPAHYFCESNQDVFLYIKDLAEDI